MSRKAFLYFALLLCGMSAVFTACNDDLDDLYSGGFPEGEAVMSIEANFSPFSSNTIQTRAGNTVAPPGKGMDTLIDMCLLAYDKDGRLMERFPMEVPFTPNELNDIKRNDADASNNKTAESTTKCLKKNVTLPYGEYYLIAVANLTYTDAAGNIQTDTKAALENRKGTYETLDELRSMKVQWAEDNFRNNREMLGFFTNDGEIVVPNSNSEFKLVKINRPNMTLHTWLRRCASKITIDFDGSELRENVYVYIEKAEIFDIASECTLGFGKENTTDDQAAVYNNTITDENKLYNRKKSVHHITYGKGDNFASWPCISKGSPKIMNGKDTVNFHAEDEYALFFYENMHGEAAVNGKTPVPDLTNGGVAHSDLKKDGVPYGTYIEVTAHYHSDATGNVTDGTIKYRFLIGKDAKMNCDAERNYHYKLTLKLRGNANDYDWHIDYKDEPGFDVPNPWYVSYLYNQRATLPFKYTPQPGWKAIKLEAEIVQNPWYPSNVTEEQLTDPNLEINPTTPYGDLKETYNNKNNKHDGNGFLSLRKDTKTVVTDVDAATTENGKFPGYSDNSANYNDAYYKGKANGNSIDLSKREYYFDDRVDATNTGNEAYSYSRDGDKYTFNIPLFTRPKILVKQTGYSGNNPFVGYQRVAKVKLRVTLQKIDGTEKDKKDSVYVNVVQVRRVVNPKGVYRSADNYDPFHVKIMWLDGDDASEFIPSVSRGPWMAEILGDANFITLDGKQNVSGSTNTEIDFTIRFNRIKTEGNKNAIVRIWYHNYTCSHLIFVRQGYDAQALCDRAVQYDENAADKKGDSTAVEWETCNMIARNVPATDPRDEGSLFKFGQSDYAIDAINNIYTDAAGNNLYGNLLAEQFNNNIGPFRIADQDSGNLSTGVTEWKDIKVSSKFEGGLAKAATIRHFEQLYLTPNIEFGYGVLYADGAKETQTAVSDAYGYYRRDTFTGYKKAGDSPKGMRGVFAYYFDGNVNGSSYNGRSIFFPIGRAGYGHRKNKKEGDGTAAGNGILRYSCNRGQAAYNLFASSAPLFVSIFRRPGAIYWARYPIKEKYLEWNGNLGESTGYGLDFNYFSYDVNTISGSNIDNGNDACFVRCVK